MLEDIQKHLGVGKIFKHGSKAIQFRVQSFKELEIVVNKFNMYPLMTSKCSDFKLFLRVHEIIKWKEHLTEDGLRKIVAIKAAMNNGLSDVLKKAFPDVVPVVRPLVLDQKNLDPNWLAGFTSGEGCFWVNVWQNSRSVAGYQLRLVFQITQHERDENLMKSLINLFESGGVYIEI